MSSPEWPVINKTEQNDRKETSNQRQPKSALELVVCQSLDDAE
jgi:hypothetical protein